jgi:hypothetical protein
LRQLGPVVAPGEMLLTLDEVLAPACEQHHFQEVRTACLVTGTTRRYLSGTGEAFLHQVLAAVVSCYHDSLVLIADGARWIRAFFRDHLTRILPKATMFLDWYHLEQKCRDMASRICRSRPAKAILLRRLFRRLWAGKVPAAAELLETYRPQAKNASALDELVAYLQARAEWIPNYRARRRNRQYIGSGHVEQANARIVARRQKSRGMHWSALTSDALAALRTLHLNDGWDRYWVKREAFPLVRAA